VEAFIEVEVVEKNGTEAEVLAVIDFLHLF